MDRPARALFIIEALNKRYKTFFIMEKSKTIDLPKLFESWSNEFSAKVDRGYIADVP